MALAAISTAAQTVAPKLSLAPVGIQDGAGSVSFVQSGGPDPLSDNGQLPSAAAGTSNRYTVYIDPAFRLDKGNVFIINIYVRERNTTADSIYRYSFTEQASGKFLDCMSQVSLSLQDEQATETIPVVVPLHSADLTLDFIAGPDLAPAEAIEATSATTIDIPVTNRLPNMDVVITDVQVSPDHQEKWKDVSLESKIDNNHPLYVTPAHQAWIKLKVSPKFWRAVGDAVLPTPESQAADTLRLDISYASDDGGITRPYQISHTIRFVNWPGALLFAVIGAILGTFAVYFSAKPDGSLARKLLTRFSSALILTGIGIFLIANGSKFVLFTFNLDPRQLLAAFVVGVLAGLGLIDVVAFIKKRGQAGAPV